MKVDGLFKLFFKFGFLALALATLFSNAAFAQRELYIKGTTIVTTTAQVADLVRNIVGDHMKVEALMGTGTDPHLYRPTRSDLVRLRKADIIFYNGLHLEAQMVDVLKEMGKTKDVVEIASALPQKDLIYGTQKVFDPHIWMNVNNWAQSIGLVVDTVSEFDEGQREFYVAAGAAYRKKLDHLDYKIQVAMETIPRHKRILITAHDAFGYFGQAYGVAVLGVQGLSTQSEAGLKHIESLVDIIVKRKIEAVFAETSVDQRNIDALVEGAAARGHMVVIGGALYSDAMGAEGTMADSYIGMMVHNVDMIAVALGGDKGTFSEYYREYERAH